MTSSPGTPPAADHTGILAADIGSTRTKLSLFGMNSEGAWALLGSSEAFSTTPSPREGVLGGIVTAAHELEEATGRRLLAVSGGPQISLAPSGVDAFVASGSAAPDLSLVTLAPTAAHSGTAASAASEWSYVNVLDSAAFDAGMDAGLARRWADDQHANGQGDVAAKIRTLAPDAILMVGGYDGGAVSPLVDIARLLVPLRQAGRPPITVLFAGNSRAVPHIARVLAGRTDLRVAGNVLPAPETPQPGPCGEALDDLYCQYKLGALNGHRILSELCAAPIMSSARALALAWSVLSEAWQGHVLGLDIGARSTVAGSAAVDGSYRLRVHSDLGSSFGWDSNLHDMDTAVIARWLPIPMGKTEIQTRLAARRDTLALPQSKDALLFQEALTREAWRGVLDDGRAAGMCPPPASLPLNLVASGGTVAHSANLWRVALMLLDAVEPLGLVHMWMERGSALAPFGAAAALNRALARSMVPDGLLRDLGMAVCFAGGVKAGGKAADIELLLEDGSQRRTLAAWGTIHFVPTAGLGAITVTIRPTRTVYVPGHEDEKVITFKLAAEAIGLTLDCRGRPLAPQLDTARSHARMHAWIAAGEP